jgi:hypothetical protein
VSQDQFGLSRISCKEGVRLTKVAARNDGGEAMTWSDPIVEEVRRVRDAYAARFNYDLRAIFRDLKDQEKRSGRKLVSYADDATGTEPTGPATAVSDTRTR